MSSPNLTDRCDSFKSTHVGKSSSLEEEIETLPEKMKRFWLRRQFVQFLQTFRRHLSCFPKNGKTLAARRLVKIIITTLPFLSEFGFSFDKDVHHWIISCYKKCLNILTGFVDIELQQSLARSCNRYVDNVLSTGRLGLVSDVEYIAENIVLVGKLLAFSAEELIKLSEDQTFKVEEKLRLEFQKQSDLSVSRFSGHRYVLQRIALEFMDKLYIYPLEDTKFPQLPGVYFIYHVGRKQLYKGSQVFPSTRYPVYVGKSETSIANRLRDHRQKIKSANESVQSTDGQQRTEVVKLELTDFVVRFMIVDIEYYAPCIERMLIEYFSPVWNKEAMKFSFGSGDCPGNLWHEFHHRRDPKTIENVLRYLKI